MLARLACAACKTYQFLPCAPQGVAVSFQRQFGPRARLCETIQVLLKYRWEEVAFRCESTGVLCAACRFPRDCCRKRARSHRSFSCLDRASNDEALTLDQVNQAARHLRHSRSRRGGLAHGVEAIRRFRQQPFRLAGVLLCLSELRSRLVRQPFYPLLHIGELAEPRILLNVSNRSRGRDDNTARAASC